MGELLRQQVLLIRTCRQLLLQLLVLGHVPAPPASGRSVASTRFLSPGCACSCATSFRLFWRIDSCFSSSWLRDVRFCASKLLLIRDASRQLTLQLLVPGTFLRHQLQVVLADRQLLLEFLAAGTFLHQVGFGPFDQFPGIRIDLGPPSVPLCARTFFCLERGILRCLALDSFLAGARTLVLPQYGPHRQGISTFQRVSQHDLSHASKWFPSSSEPWEQSNLISFFMFVSHLAVSPNLAQCMRFVEPTGEHLRPGPEELQVFWPSLCKRLRNLPRASSPPDQSVGKPNLFEGLRPTWCKLSCLGHASASRPGTIGISCKRSPVEPCCAYAR